MPLKLLRLATILLVALLTGLAFAHVLERPAKLQYEPTLYITLQQTLYVQWGPPNVGGVLEPAAVVATALLAFFTRRTWRESRFYLGALAALLLAFPVVFFWLVGPANSAFLGTTLPEIPPDWLQQRSNWETGHAIRFGLQFTALALLVLPSAVGWVSTGSRTGR